MDRALKRLAVANRAVGEKDQNGLKPQSVSRRGERHCRLPDHGRLRYERGQMYRHADPLRRCA